jgi:hypothetical protein
MIRCLNAIRRPRLAMRLQLIVLASLLSLVGLGAVSVFESYHLLLDARIDKLHAITEQAVSIATDFERRVQARSLTRDQAIQQYRDVDRRHEGRYREDLPCRFSVAGRSATGHVVDLSEHGAYVRNGPLPSVGIRGMLTLDSVAFPLPFVVRAVEDDASHLEFELDAATAEKFRPVPEMLARHAA